MHTFTALNCLYTWQLNNKLKGTADTVIRITRSTGGLQTLQKVTLSGIQSIHQAHI